MRRIKIVKTFVCLTLFLTVVIPKQSFAENKSLKEANNMMAVATPQIFEKAKKNDNWKLAFLTGKNGQIVFMNISPVTSPNNEIGMETHKFDQIIFIAEGNANALLDGKLSVVQSGDMIFIPQGTPHNVINLNKENPLKIISVYTDTDIPANTIYTKKSDEPADLD
jgi:quercetin dioxygenase-like cupin family protein